MKDVMLTVRYGFAVKKNNLMNHFNSVDRNLTLSDRFQYKGSKGVLYSHLNGWITKFS